jgi:ketosteroid isomerase-like protein
MQPAEIATQYVNAFASGDPDAVSACVTDDFVNAHASALGSGCVGKDEYQRRLPGFLASLPGLRYDIERVITDGPWVSVCYRLHAEPGGTPVDIPGVMVIETRGGFVAQRTDYWDALTYLRQTGQA